MVGKVVSEVISMLVVSMGILVCKRLVGWKVKWLVARVVHIRWLVRWSVSRVIDQCCLNVNKL